MLQVHTPNEHWKVIPDTDGMYYISSHGRAYSKFRNKVMKLHMTKSGYYYIRYREFSSSKERNKKVHRLVAQAFIQPPSKEQNTVNHKDGNKCNNHIDNLEWVTQQENINHAFSEGLHHNPKKPVLCVELNKVFPSVREAGRVLGISSQHIPSACKSSNRTAGGYTWRYVGGVK